MDEKISALEKENRKLRELLWLNHSCTELYGDDREMQCNKCAIDFKRDSAEKISRRFAEIGILNIKKNLQELKGFINGRRRK